jgi:hypothetical protein
VKCEECFTASDFAVLAVCANGHRNRTHSLVLPPFLPLPPPPPPSSAAASDASAAAAAPSAAPARKRMRTNTAPHPKAKSKSRAPLKKTKTLISLLRVLLLSRNDQNPLVLRPHLLRLLLPHLGLTLLPSTDSSFASASVFEFACEKPQTDRLIDSFTTISISTYGHIYSNI